MNSQILILSQVYILHYPRTVLKKHSIQQRKHHSTNLVVNRKNQQHGCSAQHNDSARMHVTRKRTATLHLHSKVPLDHLTIPEPCSGYHSVTFSHVNPSYLLPTPQYTWVHYHQVDSMRCHTLPGVKPLSYWISNWKSHLSWHSIFHKEGITWHSQLTTNEPNQHTTPVVTYDGITLLQASTFLTTRSQDSSDITL
jgi:hypothetical protein